MADPSWMLLVPEAILKVAKSHIVEMGPFRSKKFALIFDYTFYNVLEI